MILQLLAKRCRASLNWKFGQSGFITFFSRIAFSIMNNNGQYYLIIPGNFSVKWSWYDSVQI